MFLKPSSKKSITQMSDAALLEQYTASSEVNLLGELYGRYVNLVYGLCLKYLKDRQESQDMVMQIFEKLIIKLPSQKIKDFKSWLYTFSKNECLMYLRKQKVMLYPEFWKESNEEGMETGSPLHLIEQEENEDLEVNLQKLEKGIHLLPLEQRCCVELFYLGHKSYKQISEITGYEASKVKSYIQNGKRNLRIYLEKEAGNLSWMGWVILWLWQ